MRIDKRVGIIGAGHIGDAMISGLLRSRILIPDKIQASDNNREICVKIAEAHGISCQTDNRKLVEESGVVIVAVKPKDIVAVLKGIKDVTTPDHLVISVAAGVKIGYIEKRLGGKVQVVRVMPNIPVVVGVGMTVLSAGVNVTEENLKVARVIFSSVGRVAVVEEKNLDAVTGLSGGGPAYICLVIEALCDAGVKVGLPRDVAMTLAAQTTLGSAKMVLESGRDPAELREMVATPGGVTVEGVKALEAGGLRAAFREAVLRATARSKELAME